MLSNKLEEVFLQQFLAIFRIKQGTKGPSVIVFLKLFFILKKMRTRKTQKTRLVLIFFLFRKTHIKYQIQIIIIVFK